MGTNRRKALLFRLAPELADELTLALADVSLNIEAQPCKDSSDLAAHDDAGWVFTTNLAALEEAISFQEAQSESVTSPKVVMVSHLDETGLYLEAMERGAHDYCCRPFERQHLQWLLETKREP